MYQDLSTCHDWPVKNVIVDLPIKMKGNSKRSSCNSLSPLGVQNKDLVAPGVGGGGDTQMKQTGMLVGNF